MEQSHRNFSRPQVIENSRQYLLLRSEQIFYRKQSLGAPVVSYIFPLFTIRNTISKNVQGTRGAILTTHSMEEADALCSRVGIMVKGRLK